MREGNIWWSWKTDLGANFIGSYSFYLLFSPFFWLTLPFPTSFVPHLMAPLLVLKSACAAVTAYWYLRRFVRDGDWAVFGSLLYAFSGFAVYNIFFNHFHEAIVFFPLLLIGLEKAMTENRHGLFALAVAINAVVNYWFFIGEAVFLVFYFCCRLASPQWRLTVKRFFGLAAETLLGMGLAMFAFLPSVLAIMGNPRTPMKTCCWGGIFGTTPTPSGIWASSTAFSSPRICPPSTTSSRTTGRSGLPFPPIFPCWGPSGCWPISLPPRAAG